MMSHAEPDHAGAIPYLMKINSRARLVTSDKGAGMAQTFYRVSENRIVVVKDRESVSLDDKTLQFIATPMLHWPETMFTYVPGRRVLFSCDFFGTHVAWGLYDNDNEVEDVVVHAKRYFGEIMMLFRTVGQRTIEKVDGLAIDVIAPSHGLIYRNPERILEAKHTAGGWKEGRKRRPLSLVPPQCLGAYIHRQHTSPIS